MSKIEDQKNVYRYSPEDYDKLISFEDYQHNLTKHLDRHFDFTDKDVLDLGAGTGRLTGWIARCAKSIQAYDSSKAMLKAAAQKLKPQHADTLSFHVKSHQDYAFEKNSADIIISGWSLCYLVTDDPVNWEKTLRDLLTRFSATLRKAGRIIIIETMGTGCATPTPPDHLIEYFEVLEDLCGFKKETIRTDYRFPDLGEARRLVELFFGPQTAAKIDPQTLLLPENTAIFSNPTCACN